MKLDTAEWKKFRLGDIFDIKKGKRLTSDDQTEGATPYIGAIDSNNGISNYIGQPPIHDGNTISLSYNGSVGEAFYQPVSFWATDDVNVLYFKNDNLTTFNRCIALFICAILRQEKYRYCYGRKWVLDSMKETNIKLPVQHNQDGSPVIDPDRVYSDDGYLPDWQYMEDYIKSLNCKPISSNVSKQSAVDLNIQGWRDFYLHNLFDAEMGNGIDAVVTTDVNPKYLYVTRKNDYNFYYVDEMDCESPFPSGSMTLALGGSLGACFIHNTPFYTGQNIAVLKDKSNLSVYVKLFIATLIKNECKIKYQAFGRELNAHYKKDFAVKLPIQHNPDGSPVIDPDKAYSEDGYIPDWQYMEGYIKSLPYSDRI